MFKLIYFQIIDPHDKLISNDNNPKIINDTSKIPYLLKFCGKGVRLTVSFT